MQSPSRQIATAVLAMVCALAVGCDGCLLDPLHRGPRLGLVAGRHDDGGSGFVKGLCHFLSETGARSSDDGEFVVESLVEVFGDL